LERGLAEVDSELEGALVPLPNLPDPTAAPGPEDEVLVTVGEIPALAFEPRDHLELAGG
jgi:seryl-tRNA synthetase